MTKLKNRDQQFSETSTILPRLWQEQKCSLDGSLCLVDQEGKQVQYPCRLTRTWHFIFVPIRQRIERNDAIGMSRRGIATGIQTFQQSIQQ